MESDQQITLSVRRWAAWAPGLTDQSSWHAWSEGTRAICGPVAPDVKFVAPMMRRRLSRLSRMAFRVAADCLSEEQDAIAFVFCSRYGEYHRSYGILENLAAGEPASAAAFSMSVHNTAASLFAIETQNTAQATALSGGEATLEAAFLEAWSLMSDGAAPAVLVVYHDEPLPELYRDSATTVRNSAAFAMLLRPPESGDDVPELQLSWGLAKESAVANCDTPDPALEVLRLLLRGGDPVVLDTGRLIWTWSRNAAAA